RDKLVTGVQTCALPISQVKRSRRRRKRIIAAGICQGSGFTHVVAAVAVGIEISANARNAAFAGVLDAVGVGVVIHRAADEALRQIGRASCRGGGAVSVE